MMSLFLRFAFVLLFAFPSAFAGGISDSELESLSFKETPSSFFSKTTPVDDYWSVQPGDTLGSILKELQGSVDWSLVVGAPDLEVGDIVWVNDLGEIQITRSEDVQIPVVSEELTEEVHLSLKEEISSVPLEETVKTKPLEVLKQGIPKTQEDSVVSKSSFTPVQYFLFWTTVIFVLLFGVRFFFFRKKTS